MVRIEDNRRSHDTTPQEALQQADHLVWQGQFPRALEHLDRLETQEDLPAIAHLQGQLLRCRIFSFQDPKKAQDLTLQVIRTSQDLNQPLIQVDACLLMAETWLLLGMFDTSLHFMDQGKNVLATLPPDMTSERTEREALVLGMEGALYVYKGELDRAIEYAQHSVALFKQFPDSKWRMWPLYTLGFAYNQQGEYERALDVFQDCLTLSEQLDIPIWRSGVLSNLGFIYINQGENAWALEYFQQSLTICEQVGAPYWMANNFFFFGVIYAHQGKFEQAFEVLQDSLTICEQLGIPGTLAESIVSQQIGLISLQKGELDRALEYLEKSLALEETRGYKAEVAWDLIYISRVYRLQGQLEKAFESALKSLKINEETNNYLYTAFSLEALISISVELDQLASAQYYLQRLEGLKEKTVNKQIDQRTTYARALLLKASPRPRDKIKAQELFQQVTEEEIHLLDLTVQANLHLCELLLFEYKIAEDPAILQEIQAITKRLLDLAQTHHAYSILAETYVLQAKLALLEREVARARRLLTQAQIIADDKGLQRLAQSISHEHDRVLAQISQWEPLPTPEAPVVESRDVSDVEELLTRMTRQRAPKPPDLHPEEPVLLLVLTESGLSLFSQKFALGEQLDPQLIGGLLTAINHFGKDAFRASEGIDRIVYHEYTVAVKPFDVLLACYVFQGESYLALQKLDQFIVQIQESPSIWPSLRTVIQPDPASKTAPSLDPVLKSGLQQLITAIFQSDGSISGSGGGK